MTTPTLNYETMTFEDESREYARLLEKAIAEASPIDGLQPSDQHKRKILIKFAMPILNDVSLLLCDPDHFEALQKFLEILDSADDLRGRNVTADLPLGVAKLIAAHITGLTAKQMGNIITNPSGAGRAGAVVARAIKEELKGQGSCFGTVIIHPKAKTGEIGIRADGAKKKKMDKEKVLFGIFKSPIPHAVHSHMVRLRDSNAEYKEACPTYPTTTDKAAALAHVERLLKVAVMVRRGEPTAPLQWIEGLASGPLASAPLASGPLASAPFNAAPLTSAPFNSAPFDSVAFDSAPFNSAPLVTAPFNSAPLVTAPFNSAPFDSAPFNSAPLVTAPFNAAPLVSAPFNAAPLVSAPFNARTLAFGPLASSGFSSGFSATGVSTSLGLMHVPLQVSATRAASPSDPWFINSSPRSSTAASTPRSGGATLEEVEELCDRMIEKSVTKAKKGLAEVLGALGKQMAEGFANVTDKTKVNLAAGFDKTNANLTAGFDTTNANLTAGFDTTYRGLAGINSSLGQVHTTLRVQEETRMQDDARRLRKERDAEDKRLAERNEEIKRRHLEAAASHRDWMASEGRIVNAINRNDRINREAIIGSITPTEDAPVLEDNITLPAAPSTVMPNDRAIRAEAQHLKRKHDAADDARKSLARKSSAGINKRRI